MILISQKIHDADLLKLGIPSYDSAMIISIESGYINEADLLEYLNKVAIPQWNKKKILKNFRNGRKKYFASTGFNVNSSKQRF